MKTRRIIKEKSRGVESILLENNVHYFNIKNKNLQSLYLAISCIHMISERGRCKNRKCIPNIIGQSAWVACGLHICSSLMKSGDRAVVFWFSAL